MSFSTDPSIVFIMAVLVAVTTQLFASKIKSPPILLWLFAGMLIGPSGLHLLHIESVEAAIHPLINLGLAIILFEGGLNMNLKALKEHGWLIGKLVIIGPLLTILIGGGMVHMLTDIDWSIALLLGAIISVGGPTVIIPIIRQVKLHRNLSHILSSEAMLIDAVGAILAIVILQMTLLPDAATPLTTLQTVAEKFIVGITIGIAGGYFLARVLMTSWVHESELRSVFTLASAWGIFALSEALSSQAGLLAVLIAGITMQRMNLPDIQRLRRFKGSLSILLISLLFILLAADLDLRLLQDYLWEGVATFCVLALVVRPLVAGLSTTGTDFPPMQTLFLAGMAPRGVVAAAIASLFALLLNEVEYPGADVLVAIVYIVLILSVLCYGTLASPLAKWLKVESGNENSVLIIGGGQMGAELGRVLSQDREIRFLDLNAEIITTMQSAGYTAVRGNAMDPLYMDIVHAEEVGTILVMTGSSDHNILIAHQAKEHFHIQNIYIALQEGDEKKYAKMIRQLGAMRLFAKPYTFTYWHDQVYRKRLVHDTQVVDEKLAKHLLSEVRIPHGVQPMAILREGKTLVPHDGLRLMLEDEIYLLLRPERTESGQPFILPPAQRTQAK
ncbi:MAG: sodium:proton antiporter [Zetaproteobacteria bacterium]|nr:sodium:proton antiporter [Zetaproteobacteria bacterium]